MQKIVFNKDKLKIIDSLLIVLQEAGFIYHCKIEIEKDKKGNPISYKLKQI